MGATWADLLLAAGTVFNQVVLWTPATVNRIDSLSGNKIATIMHGLKGHEVCQSRDCHTVILIVI